MKVLLNKNLLLNKLCVMVCIFTLFGCASKPNWKKVHYQNANAGAQCMQFCNTGQFQAALNAGCNCNSIKKAPLSRSASQSNGNVNNIYLNQSGQGYGPQNRSNIERAGQLFRDLANQEKQERWRRIDNFNKRN